MEWKTILRSFMGHWVFIILFVLHEINIYSVSCILSSSLFCMKWIIYIGCFFFPTCSNFRDIFDEDFFIHTLRNHVNVVRELPEDILQRFDNNISNIVNLRVKAWSSPTYYLHKVLPKLVNMGYVYLFLAFILAPLNLFPFDKLR